MTDYKKSSVMIKAGELQGKSAGHRRENPVAAALATKLVRDTRHGGNGRHYGNNLQARADVLYGQSDKISTNMNDVENIFEVLPEIARCEMIITSCILSPDDMKTINLRYVCDSTTLPAKVKSEMLSVMEEFCTKTYNIKAKLPKILSATLFRTGSYPILCIPESSLDLLINHDNRIGMESLNSVLPKLGPIGALGDTNATLAKKGTTVNVSLESMLTGRPQPMMDNRILPGITVTDNPDVLKIPDLQRAMGQQRTMDCYRQPGVGTESYDDTRKLNDLARRLYRRRRNRVEDIVRIRTQDQTNRNSVGHPMLMDLASDGVIPVVNPSNTEEHFGYFLIIGPYGNVISNAVDSPYVGDAMTKRNQSQTEASSILAQMKTNIYGQCSGDADHEFMTQMYHDVMEFIDRDLLERFSNGAMKGCPVQIARTNAVSQIMWSRILANKETQLVYVPAELLTYFAFDYNKLGIGKSLTDGTKILASLRALLLFATTRSSVRAAVGHKTLNLRLDPNIQDPEKWVQGMVHEYVRVNNGNYPLATSNPNDIMSYLNEAGVSVNVTGHPGYPEVESSLEQVASAVTQIDPEIDRDLGRRQIAHYGLPPEVVDASTGVDFAATIRTSNVFLDKQMTHYAHRLCDMTSDHLRMITANSGTLMADLYAIVDANSNSVPDADRTEDLRNEWVLAFLEAFRIELPESNNTRYETQLQKLSTFSQTLDAVFAAFATTEVLQQLDPNADRDTCEAILTVMRQHFLREFIIAEGILPDVTKALTWPGEEDDPALDFMATQTTYIDTLRKTLDNLMQSLKAKSAPPETQQDNDGNNPIDDY